MLKPDRFNFNIHTFIISFIYIFAFFFMFSLFKFYLTSLLQIYVNVIFTNFAVSHLSIYLVNLWLIFLSLAACFTFIILIFQLYYAVIF